MIKKTHDELIEQFRGTMKKINKKEIIKVPQKNVKVIKLNNKIDDKITQHSLFHNDLQELCKLYEDVQICVNFFENEAQNEKIQNMWGKDNLQSYKEQCQDLKQQIEVFAKENDIDLRTKSYIDNENYTIADIRQKLKYLNIQNEEEPKEYLLTKDLNYRQKYILLQRLQYLQKALENIEQNIGDLKEDETLLQTFLELKEDLDLLKVENMKKNNEKLTIVARELNKNYIDRKMNYFNHLQKDEFKKFFALFDNTKKLEDTEDPEQVFQNFIENQDNLEKAAKIYKQFTLAKDLLGKYQLQSEDNYQFLKAIKQKMKEALGEQQFNSISIIFNIICISIFKFWFSLFQKSRQTFLRSFAFQQKIELMFFILHSCFYRL